MNNQIVENLPAESTLDLSSTDSIEIYLNQLRQTPLLSKEEELSLFKKLNTSDDLDAARKLVMAHLRFVVHVAKTYKGYGLPLLDLIQEGNIGLMKAVKKFDPSKNVRLLSFAIYWIRAEIHEFVIKNWRIVKVATTKAQRKLFFKLRSKKKDISWLTESERKNIAQELNVKSEIVTLMESRLSGNDVSYDPSDEDEISPSTYLTDNIDPLTKLQYENDNSVNLNNLESAMSRLDERSKDIIKQRYLLEDKTTLDELSKKYKISKERVRQIENQSLDMLKNNMLIA